MTGSPTANGAGLPAAAAAAGGAAGSARPPARRGDLPGRIRAGADDHDPGDLCHSADALSPSLLRRLLKVEGGAAE